MGKYYLDIETTGLDPAKSKILTLQYQALDRKSGRAVTPLTVLKEWESSEKAMLERFIRETGIVNPDPFAFVPVGYNLNFEHNFLKERSFAHGLETVDVLSKPFLDLRVCGILMNDGEFKGSGLDKITGKPHDGRVIPDWYEKKEYEKIVEYVEKEAFEFVRFYSWLCEELPECLRRFKSTYENPANRLLLQGGRF